LKTGEASALFGKACILSKIDYQFLADYLADSVDTFLTTHPTANEDDCPSTSDLPLGLTFSFPVEQTALGSGTILTWTKGFSATNAVGHDVVKLLQDAFDRKRMHVKCVALVNDVSSTLIL
jgi:hexokinase